MFPEATLPDWITAGAAVIGIFPLAYGLVKLFLRDREKEERLKFYEEQLNELRQQTSEFQHQTALMKSGNELLEKQLNLQADMFLKTSAVEEKKLEIQQLQRLEQIKPYFIFHGGSIESYSFSATFRNGGGTAINIRIHSVSNAFAIMTELPRSHTRERGQILELGGHADVNKTYHGAEQLSVQILLAFEDIDNNTYFQNISKTGSGFAAAAPYRS